MIPAAAKVCCNFPETLHYLPADKAVLTGSPIRQELLAGNKINALNICGFTASKPTILVVGGSSGSVFINNVIRGLLPELLKEFQVIHLCGKGRLDPDLNSREGYAQFEYANQELRDFFALADIVISRAGANAICELLALRKPNILIPLSTAASRGDQLLNAASFENQGFSIVIEEEKLGNILLLESLHKLQKDKEKYIVAMNESEQLNSIDTIISILEEAANAR